MRVLVFSTVFPNRAHPMHGLFVFERIRHLGAKADIRVVAPVSWMSRLRSTIPREESIGGLHVVHPTFFYVPAFFKVVDGVMLFLSSVNTVRKLKRDFPFDLIDAHFAFPEGFAAVLLGKYFRRPVTITLRGTLIPLSVYRLRRMAIAWTLRRATRLIAVAHPLADHAIRLGADSARVTVIPNGVSADTFAPIERGEARGLLGLHPTDRLIVSVGHLSSRKGFHRVIAVMPELIKSIPDLRFAVVGGAGAERNNEAELRALVRDRGLTDRVLFAGAQPPAMVARWLSAADVFVLASDFEGCPNVVWEALASGRPVVATRVGEVDRMVPSFGGVLFDRADDAAALRDSLLHAFGTAWDASAIRAYAAIHTWSDVADQVLAEWRKALDPTDSPAAHRPDVSLKPARTDYHNEVE